ncbi:pitrilysin family protein [Schinkia azotoformans]|uniref:Peptidase M16 domain-containing protein n=2 Tax=Schinkia azotoformans TaxID=1454 RepID=K6D687_SCHAZ|nr:pitrilysin family protein [Schinkia azotoformans]EKN68007.1 peptidase M16 domain-containing protein [Schinkia azotoformans LMG 9581]MEC1638188.1 pitrilysin family protein [Schinkia azotoformans]MEC1721924.1 pitrilysin family protein [Schinkia azotoformans]MEC1946378.1 pitrilysin family protein [Schinkia azotoformans]MED4411678.1 pitrilysin family protein [Schinkia azotoformans]
MNLMKEESVQLDGFTLHGIETLKYKTNTIVLKMKAPLQEDTVTTRALLPYVLQSGTEKFPSTLKLRTKLDELYGASLNIDVAKKGEYQIITIRMDIANEKYLTDQTPLLKNGLELIAEILLSPVMENGVFLGSIVEKEKRALKSRIQAVYDDKMRYANMRLIQEMCEEEPYRLNAHGNINDLDKISAQVLYDYYQNALQNDEIDLYIVGDINLNSVKEAAEKAFRLPANREKRFVKTNVAHKKVSDVKEIIEEQDIKQGKLHIGCRTNVTYHDDDYFALQLYNGIFGGFSHSKLFINVREKESLAYYAASRFESHKGLLMIMSGIEFANYQKAVNIIKEQMEEMKKGNFTDDEFSQTKAVLKNQILETIDTPNGLIEVLYHNVVAGFSRPLDDWLTKIDEVTKDEVEAVAKKVNLDTIYFLRGLEGA